MDNQNSGSQHLIGSFNNLPEGAEFWSGGTEFEITYLGGDGNDVVITAVPEPLALGLALPAGLLLRRRRRLAGA